VAAGSPYTMEIIDAADVEASGDGLETAEVNRRATFNVDIGRNGSSRDLKVQIRCKPFIYAVTAVGFSYLYNTFFRKHEQRVSSLEAVDELNYDSTK